MAYLFFKRLLDIVLSLIIIIILIPVFIVLFPWLRFTGEGYIFYLQKRIGYQQKPFNILKFATMLKDSPNMGAGLVTLRNDPRVTPAGKFLRMTKLNELPQIFNVFRGDMSFVGPRPLVDKTFENYPQHIKDRICDAKPGITGIGSIVFRDEEKLLTEQKGDPKEYQKNVIMPYKGELEMWYLKHRSFWVDLVILFLTGWTVIFSQSRLVYQVFKDLPKPIQN